jgi:prepilin-type N-terminal cleavage/methylation domain-containing protein
MELVLKKQRELRKNRKKGFTLVELIVVIVILAILAAIAVPALTGYIDKARQAGAEAEAGSIRTTLQMIGTEIHGRDATVTLPADGSTNLPTVPTFRSIQTGAGPFSVASELSALTTYTITPGDLTAIAWNNADGRLVAFTYKGTVYTN